MMCRFRYPVQGVTAGEGCSGDTFSQERLSQAPFQSEFYLLINKSFGQVAKLINAAVAQEGPPSADVLAAVHIDFHY